MKQVSFNLIIDLLFRKDRIDNNRSDRNEFIYHSSIEKMPRRKKFLIDLIFNRKTN